VEVAVQCLAAAADYSTARVRNAKPVSESAGSAAPVAVRIIDVAAGAGRDLLEPEARDVLKAYGIAVPRHVLARSAAEAQATVKIFGDAKVAMKVVSADILHKSEAKGVKLNVAGTEALQAAFVEIAANARAYRQDARVEGMLLTPMADRGTEVIIGVTRDAQYGPVILFGLGGVFVEVISDVVFRALPITLDDAREMIGDLRYAAMLDGTRGAEPVNREALADLLLRVSRIAQLHPQIAEIDLNPVIARADGYTIVDARMVFEKRA
jgi:acetyltransferase